MGGDHVSKSNRNVRYFRVFLKRPGSVSGFSQPQAGNEAGLEAAVR